MNNRRSLANTAIPLLAAAWAHTPVCAAFEAADLDPAGPVARSIDELFWLTSALMALILIPVFALTIWVLVRYRASNYPNSPPDPWEPPVWLEWTLWLFPAVIVALLATTAWIYTHRLAPDRPLAENTQALEIQAVALDWKWLFIYPEQSIATVNQVAFPVKREVTFKITSGTVMNAFFIPRLAGQIYAMAGMVTQLHLQADRTGRYWGQNSQYSGAGFPFQNFSALSLSSSAFEDWVRQVKSSGNKLNWSEYRRLAGSSIDHPVEYFASADRQLFAKIIAEGRVVPQPQPKRQETH